MRFWLNVCLQLPLVALFVALSNIAAGIAFIINKWDGSKTLGVKITVDGGNTYDELA